MQVIRAAGREAGARKYDILSALLAHAMTGEPGLQRLTLRLVALITARYNWQRDELVTGQREIARLWCVDERTVKRDMARLRALGWVVVKRQGARGRVSVLGLDLGRIVQDTRAAWPNIGPDFIVRMGTQDAPDIGSTAADPATSGPPQGQGAANVVPFARPDGLAPPRSDLWERACALLRAEDRAGFDAWVRPLVEIGQGEGALHLMAPSRFHATYLRTHLLGRLQSAVGRIDPSTRLVRIDAP